MDLMGHKTRSCSERYNIVNVETRRKAAAMLTQPAPQAQSTQKPQSEAQGQAAEAEGHSSGIAAMPKAMAEREKVQ